jgi:hypothetical protein
MPQYLKRRLPRQVNTGRNDRHFITFCYYHRKRLLDSVRCRRLEKAGRDSSTRRRRVNCASRLLRGSEGRRKVSACCARNDRDVLCGVDRGWVAVTVEWKKAGRDSSTAQADSFAGAKEEEKRRLATLGMTVMCFAVKINQSGGRTISAGVVAPRYFFSSLIVQFRTVLPGVAVTVSKHG